MKPIRQFYTSCIADNVNEMERIHISVQPVSSLQPITATARYLVPDYALIVEPEAAFSASMHRISIDTLTLWFRPMDNVLLGLDAYTNSKLWHRQRLTLPPVDREVGIQCNERFDVHGIGPKVSAQVRYMYSEDTSLLLLKVGEGQVTTRIRCLSCGICGLESDGGLIEMWLQDLRFNTQTRI